MWSLFIRIDAFEVYVSTQIDNVFPRGMSIRNARVSYTVIVNIDVDIGGVASFSIVN